MLISTRGRYALRVMIDLAQHRDEGYVPMKDVAERQGISLKYIGGIMPVLTKNKLVDISLSSDKNGPFSSKQNLNAPIRDWS